MQRFTFEELDKADLVVDAVYEGGRSGTFRDDPLPRLLGVNNQGGFRYLGKKESPHLIVLTSSFVDPDWPDSLDRETGTLIYYGDNKKPGFLLHETPRFGNFLLREIFDAVHSEPPRRIEVPPVLIFGRSGTYRDVMFLGVAVPGSLQLGATEDLVAVWRITGGQRFQNYQASFTILDISRVQRTWINEIKCGNPFGEGCDTTWSGWIRDGVAIPLTAEQTTEHRTKDEQLPSDQIGREIIATIHQYFAETPTAFEACAAKLAQMMDKNFVSFDMTRPSRDGGRDAVGKYRIGHGESAIFADFALEAKCYSLNNSVGVREVSRLISRLRHRQFGVLVTTSYVNSQAYQEVKEDGHPVVIVSSKDIVAILIQAGLTNATKVKQWLAVEFPLGPAL